MTDIPAEKLAAIRAAYWDWLKNPETHSLIKKYDPMFGAYLAATLAAEAELVEGVKHIRRVVEINCYANALVGPSDDARLASQAELDAALAWADKHKQG